MGITTELKEVSEDTLEKKSVLGQIKTKRRPAIFNALGDPSERYEYLECNEYKHTASILIAECAIFYVGPDRQNRDTAGLSSISLPSSFPD
uniref:Uncharacterized protein n=1 Tax=Salvator merianae TaxID=96440 RepID=A0A8D0DHQ8_SALMN